ncbi:coiled-coil domain-containing protein-domain-containing protein [Blastocladiella britannica]|nr:coiled-coil domain-containing protein-domain-containing protein [Blastocladiella britannica]
MDATLKKTAHNRRLYYLRTVMPGSEYFSLAAMYARAPRVYASLFPDLAPPAPEPNAADWPTNGMLGSLLDAVDHEHTRTVAAGNESEHESDDEDDEGDGRSDQDKKVPPAPPRAEDLDPVALAEWKRAMEERWLDGLEVDFDYAAVDGNPDLDDVEIQARDAEDAWFAEDDSDSDDPQQHLDQKDQSPKKKPLTGTDTGELDY